MATLVPTVLERIARCGTGVPVTGLEPGATVVVTVGGMPYQFTATHGSHNFSVPSLTAGDVVTARQDSGSGFTPESPPVTVEDAVVPPTAAPLLPSVVGHCSQCVSVDGLVPGCEVELYIGTQPVGKGFANRHGGACVGVTLDADGRDLRARMLVCGSPGPDGTSQIIPDSVLPEPVIEEPVYACQRVIKVHKLLRGAPVAVELNQAPKGQACPCGNSVSVWLSQLPAAGDSVRANQYWQSDVCQAKGPYGKEVTVVEPDEGIKPVVLDLLIAGDQIIRVDNQIGEAHLWVLIRPYKDASTYEEFGPRPAGDSLEIALNQALVAGAQVAVRQELCGHAETSEWVDVLPAPTQLYPPIILPPLFECAGAVQVSGLHPGALVRLYQDGYPTGVEWAGMASSISVAAAPALVAGGKVTALQEVGGMQSPESTPAVVVQSMKGLHFPRILQPVAVGENTIWVSHVTPGARVGIRQNGTLIGEVDAAEPIVRVPVIAVPSNVKLTPTAKLCSNVIAGPPINPIKSPCAKGSWSESGEEFRDYGTFNVPVHNDDGGFEHPIRGQFYFPARDAERRPLVIIAHGHWPYQEASPSYLGYAYLARHLASWGMYVFSIDMDKVNSKTGTPSSGPLQQIARGEIILEAVQRVMNDPNMYGQIDPGRIGVIGHSMAGEGVVAAQMLGANTYNVGIQAVVSIAPTHWEPSFALQPNSHYLQIYGSWDLVLNSGDPGTQSFRVYDLSPPPKTHFWIYRARHNPFNNVWATGSNNFETDIVDDTLTIGQHQTIAKCLINAFLLDVLLKKAEYRGFLEGIILPHEIRHLDIFAQHLDNASPLIDDFENAGKTSNSLGKNVTAAGPGLVLWEEIDHTTLNKSRHVTKSVELAWNQPDVEYRTDTGGMGLSSNDFLSLRISQYYQDDTLNPIDQEVDLFVTLSDGNDEATVRLGAVATVPYPDPTGFVTSVLRTVRIPLDAFAVNMSLSNVSRIRFRLIGRSTGHILIDDIEIVS